MACMSLAVIVVLPGVMLGCHAQYREDPDKGVQRLSDLTLTEKDNGKSVVAHVGDTIELSLPENPSTGFRWALEQDKTQHLEILDVSRQPAADMAMPGRGNRHVWRFRILQAGDTQLALRLWRTWEGDKSIIERYNVVIAVR